MPPRRIQKLAFPFKGINENFGYEDQPPGTTPDAENVRPHAFGVTEKGRMRGGSRPGLSPYVTDTTGAELKFRQEKTTDTGVNSPIQEIVQIPSTEIDEHLGDGMVFYGGRSDGESAAASVQLNEGTAKALPHDALEERTYNCSAWDADGYCYVATVKEFGSGDPAVYDVEIYKFDRAGTRVGGFEGGFAAEDTNRAIPCRVTTAGRQVLGIAIHNSIIYLWIRNVAKVDSSAFDGSFIFRVGTDGAMKDAGGTPYWFAWADSDSESSLTAVNGRGLLDECAGHTDVIWTTAGGLATVTSNINNLLYASGGVLYVLTNGLRPNGRESGSWIFCLDIQKSVLVQAHRIHGSKLTGKTVEYDLTGDGSSRIWAVTGGGIDETDRVTLYEPSSAKSIPEVGSTENLIEVSPITVTFSVVSPFTGDIAPAPLEMEWTVVTPTVGSIFTGTDVETIPPAVAAYYAGESPSTENGRSVSIRSLAYDPINGLLLIAGRRVLGYRSNCIAALDPSTLDVAKFQVGTLGGSGGDPGESPSPTENISLTYGDYAFDSVSPDYPITLKVNSEIISVDSFDATDSTSYRDGVFDCLTGEGERGTCGTTAPLAGDHAIGVPVYQLITTGDRDTGVHCIRATGYDARELFPGTTFAVGKSSTGNTVRLLSNFNIARDSSGLITQNGTNILGLDSSSPMLNGNSGYTKVGSLGNAVNDNESLGAAFSAQYARRETISPDHGIRALHLLAVCGGEVAQFEKNRFSNRDTGTASKTAALGLTSRHIGSARFGGNVYFCDGTNYVNWIGVGRLPVTWLASSGSLPKDRTGSSAKLAATWRGRIVLSGIASEPRNWFMSSLGDPLNWDYFPSVNVETQAVAGNNSDAGLSGDVVNTLIPYSDDLLLFGGDRTIWQMTGDPMSGGRLDLISDITGIAFGNTWCKDPLGVIYFFGSKGGVFRMIPGQKPQTLSQTSISESLFNIDVDSTSIRLAWNHREMGVHVFLTPLDLSLATKHYFYDLRTESWWRDSFSSPNHNPTAVAEVDGFASDDRSLLLGVQDGGILKWDASATGDNGTAIDSYVLVGPIKGGTPLSSVRLEELEGTLASGSGSNISYSVQKGSSSELAATASSSLFDGTITGSTRMVDRRKAVGKEIYLKIRSASDPWAMESFSCILSDLPIAASRRFR